MTQNQTTNAGRITIIDALRGFALFGVIWVHFQQHFSYFSMGPFNEHTPILSQFNETVQWLTNNVMMGRFINIFAFRSKCINLFSSCSLVIQVSVTTDTTAFAAHNFN